MVSSTPYWWEDAPPASPPQDAVQGKCDVVIVGAGYTGLSAGLTLARAGRSVQIFDRQRPGEGASTRNGGIASGNLRPSHRQMVRRFGTARANAIQAEAKAAREDLAEFVRREAIDCDFQLTGRFTGAAKPGEYEGLAREADLLRMTLGIEAYAVPGKAALYLEDARDPLAAREGDSIGLRVSDPATGAALHYIPGCASVDASLAQRLRGAHLVLFDGTLYTDEELIAQGLSQKTGRRMGHMSMSGPQGSMAAFAALGVERRIFVHINNSNPTLREGSPERTAVERAGWEIAYDGMEIQL